ncbi:MAG: hypothetical protein JHC52_09110 [Chthoniobacterales bacterium]|jgi:hypothetical protein|nr:hypothetical protein [Chthoniobacterales bacterium]
MKKYIITALVTAVAATSAAVAGTEVSSKKTVVAMEEPCLYRDNELQLDAFGLGGFYRSGNPVWGGGIGVNYFFLRYIGLGIEQSVAGGNGSTDWGTFGHLFLRYPFCWGLSPYAMVGIGKIYGSNPSVGGGDVGGGIEWRFTENIGLFGDARWFYSPDISNSGGVIARTGLRFAF